jgi:hypothetical protein
LNVTGPEILSIKWIAEKLGTALDRRPVFVNEPEQTALLNNASECHHIFGYPQVGILEIIDITAKWMLNGGGEFGKDTHFQERGGKF